MDRRLVKLDPRNGWGFSEVAPIRLEREARILKAYIETHIDPADDPYDIRGVVLPLCNGVLDGRLSFPMRFADFPLKYPCREGLVLREFDRLYGHFEIAASGSHLERPEEVLVDGERWAYMDFEEPGDWPDKVKYP